MLLWGRHGGGGESHTAGGGGAMHKWCVVCHILFQSYDAPSGQDEPQARTLLVQPVLFCQHIARRRRRRSLSLSCTLLCGFRRWGLHDTQTQLQVT